MVETIAKCIALIIVGAIVVFLSVWVLGFTLLVFALVFVLWLLNFRFNVTSKGVKIGTYTRKGGFRQI